MKKKLPQTNKVRSTVNCYLFILPFFIFLSTSVFAEGTPTLSPNANNITAVLSAPDLSNGSYFNAPEDNRIYFNIANASTENLYFGFDWREYSVGNPNRINNLYYRIRRPDGTVAVTALWNSANSVAGSIDSHAKALAGPNIGSVTTGYTPLVFDPTVSGEHWIEFYRSNDGGVTPLTSSADRSVGALFDMTVANNTGTFGKKSGRLHSDKWGFVAVTPSYGNTTTATSESNFYAYTDDKVVLFIDFNPGFQPIAFNVAVNSYGVSQTGGFNITRRSVNAATSPSLLNGFKVFLNNPDSNLYPIASIPAAPTFLNPAIINCGPYLVRFNISEAGDVKLFFDLNGVSGYQNGTNDRIIEAYGLPTGDNSVSWDGLDGLGNVVNDGSTVNLTLNFLKGRFNLPLYDVELNTNGFNVSSIAPIAIANSQMFWDDSQLTNVGSTCLTDGSTSENNTTGAGLNNSLIGTTSPGRAWSANGNLLQTIPALSSGSNETDGTTCNDYGNVRLLNTWGWGLASASVSTNIFKGCSDLKVVKTVSNSSPTFGSDVTFTITASNLGVSNDTNVVINDAIPNGYTIVSVTPSTGTWSSPNWTIGNFAKGATATLTVIAKVKKAGIYANTATISGTNSDPVAENNTSTSTPVPLNSIVDAINDAGTTVYGSTNETAITNVLSNDTLNGVAVVPAQVNTTFVSATNAGITLSGTNVIVAAGTPAGSYSLVYRICEILNPSNCDNATVTVTVTPKVLNVTVVADDQTKVYGGLNPALTATVTGAVNGDVINYTLATTATQFSNVGQYPIAVTLGTNPNYTVASTNATLTITPKAIDVLVAAVDQTKVYGDANPELTATVTGAVNGDVINYTLATTAIQFSNIGQYPVAVTLGMNPNYTVASTNATLTITPKAIDVLVAAVDQTKVYGDMNPELTATVTGDVNGDVINYTLATTATQFSNVGQYPIAVALGMNPNYTVASTNATLTITPKAIDVLVAAVDQTKVYGDMNPELTATVTGAVNGDVINYTLATTATQFSNVGDYPIAVTLGTNPNYTVASTNATLTITPKAIDVLVAAVDQTKVYGDANPTLTATVTGAVNGDVINYTLATTATQFSNVGQYPIAVTLGTNPNYTVASTNAALTITPKAIDVLVAAVDQTKVYGDANPELTTTVTGAVNGDVINYTLATTATQFSNVGDYPIAVTLGNNPNYTVASTNATLTITPKAIDVLVAAVDQTKVYGDANPELTATVTGAVNGDVINYTLATTATQFSNVGQYPIAVTLGMNPNYTVASTNATLTITPKAIDVLVAAVDQTKVYGDMNPELTATVTGAVNGDVINYTLDTTATQFSNVGQYPIAVTLGMNPNYTVASTNATLTITPKAIDVLVAAVDQTKVYGDMNPELTATVTGDVNGDVINYTLATTATQLSNVGQYPIAVTLGANPNYTVAFTNATLTITPKAIDVLVAAVDQTKVYGDANPELTATVTGDVNGDVINYTLATTATQFSNVGDYPIAVTLGTNPNYTVASTNATLTITPKAIDVLVVAVDQTKVYGDANPELTATVTGAVNGDVINYTLATTATQFSNVGQYPIAVTLETSPNYTVASTNATLTITPKAIDVLVVAVDQTKVYGDMNPELTATVTGAVNGDVINYTLATTATQFSNVGDYPIAVTLGTNPNYTVAFNNATLTITPKAIDVLVAAVDQTKVYGDANPELTATVTGAVNGDVINYTLATTATQFSNVGQYPIVVTLGTNPNYTVAFNNATLTITPKAIDVLVAAVDQTKVYGDANPTLTATVTGTVNGDVINYTLATTATQFSNVGQYPIAVTLGANPNYTVASTNATLTITPIEINAVADTNAIPVNGTTGGNSGVNVLTNDTLNGLPVNPTDVVLSSTPNGPLTVNPNGTVSVAPNTPAGSYTINYAICEVLNPTNCDTATVTIVVAAPAINAVADTNAIPVNGTTGGNSGVNVLTNDTLNGLPVNPADVVLSSTPNGPLTINPDGTVSVASNTPAGSYTINYTICEVLNPTNCDTATVTIIVAAPAIVANNDAYSNINCTSFGVIGNILANDTLNDNPAKSEDLNITMVSGENSNITFDNLGNINVQIGIANGSYILTYQICEKINPTNCDTATITINIQDATAPVIAELPVASIISCGLTPNFAQALATDTCGSINLTFLDLTLQGSCIGSYTITRTWTATDSSGNTATASQVISVQDTAGPTTTTAFTAIVNVNCDAIPTKPELVFVDNCSTVSPAIFTENIINRTENSYSIIRKWSVADACGNASEFTQTINVTIPNSVVTINSSICNDGEITTTNLNDLLPMGTPTNGTWVDVNNSGGLQGSILNASGLSVRDYTFEYKIDDVTCPRTVRVVMTVNTGCGGIVLACGTILVHNAISPNGDGINEKFIIDNIDDTVCYPDNTVEIYNRWGVLIFETKGYNNTSNVFDGSSRGRTNVSQPTGLPTGTYFYILNYTSVDNDGKIITNKKDGYLYIVNN
ncbi:MBG domain-containing protein [Flavobacterium yafengii]|uniref:MBG domain-containing protein n=1 Tax=Flavobacterium yafengii TaxID=3041253 RepID=A0AAW6TTZ3_9FLAO|nr:MBG domain-containing protein [Flavobacterium yafengii]MDI5951098.1 MBG domain-containing protein [Flavobacterium yafengii]